VSGDVSLGTNSGQTINLNSPSFGYGVVPLGAIIPVYNSLSGAMVSPGSGVVNTSGYMLCDGAPIPGGNSVSGTTPNITDNRFILGATTAGTTGGSNTKTIATTNLPAHSHVMDHGHGHTISTIDGGGHSHVFSLKAADHTHSFSGQTTETVGGLNAGGDAITEYGGPGAAVRALSYNNQPQAGNVSWQRHVHNYSGTTGGVPGGSSVSGTVGGGDGTHSHGVSGSVTAFSGSTQNTGSGTALDILPNYVTAVYLIRVK
jgi:hypothetical protein